MFRAGKIVIARSGATKQSRSREAPYVPLDRVALLAMTAMSSSERDLI
jgi:hypothetical protein